MPKLSGAKYFGVCDARSGYWTIKLDNKSSLLTTFNTPFGRYRFLRLPFGIISSQDVFQKRVDQTFEGLEGVEPIADDILIWGNSLKQYKERQRAMLQRTREKGIRLKSDPQKIAAIKDMPKPANKAELQTVLGICLDLHLIYQML